MVQLENGGTTQGFIPSWWFFTTHLKNIQSKLDHFPEYRGNKDDSNPNHQLGYPGTEARINDEGQWLIIITYLEMGNIEVATQSTNQSEKYDIVKLHHLPQIGETQKQQNKSCQTTTQLCLLHLFPWWTKTPRSFSTPAKRMGSICALQRRCDELH